MSRFDFDRIAREYDQFYATEFGRRIDQVEKRLVEHFLGRLEKRRLLEIGCGTGHWTAFFAERGFEVSATDVSEEMLKVAVQKRIPNAQFLRQDVQHLGFADGSVENVAAITSIEFVDDPGKGLAQIHRVLEEGGYFLIGCLNQDSILGAHKEENEIYQNASFFTPGSLEETLSRFGEPEVEGCVLLDGERLLDLSTPPPDRTRLRAEGAFLVGLVRKEKR